MRNPPKRYQDTVFHKRQIDQLQDLLGVETEKAVIFALSITVSYYTYLHKIKLRRKNNVTKTAKRQLKGIAEKSKALARLLEEHPISQELVRRRAEDLEKWLEGLHQFEDDTGTIQFWRVQEDRKNKLGELIEALKVVSDAAWFFYKNDDQFRQAVHLPSFEDKDKSAVRIYLWPSLFVIWMQVGNRIASGEGPLHKFVTLVHQACDLGDVSASTLNDAVAEWTRLDAEMKAKWEQRSGPSDAAEDLP